MNKYPIEREFKAIGAGGDDFVRAMVAAVESVLGPVPQGAVRLRPSSGGRYVCVSLGPLHITGPEQIKRIYAGMKADGRAKFLI